MTLPASGDISAANISVEIVQSSTSTRSLNDADVRTLASKASGVISYNDLHGKTWVAFNPSANGSYSAYNFGATASYTITCTINATWSYTGGTGAGGSVSIANNASNTEITFRTAASGASGIFRTNTWNVTGTASGTTRTYTITCEAET